MFQFLNNKDSRDIDALIVDDDAADNIINKQPMQS